MSGPKIMYYPIYPKNGDRLFTSQNTASDQTLMCLSFIYYHFDITRKTFFCLPFYFKWKYFDLLDHILSETICLFCFCIFFSNIYHKIKCMAKIWSDLCNFHSEVTFWNFCLRKYFLLLSWVWIYNFSQKYCYNFRKIEQAELVKSLPRSYLPYRFLNNLLSFLLWEKWKHLFCFFFKRTMTRIKKNLFIGS